LSIKPEFAEKIFAGSKRYEFRRALFKSQHVSRVVVYASSPVQRVIGEFEIEGILALSKSELWKRTKEFAGIEKKYFDNYFSDRSMAYAIQVKRAYLYSVPLKLANVCDAKSPPQSFMYLKQRPLIRKTFDIKNTFPRAPISFFPSSWRTHAEKYLRAT